MSELEYEGPVALIEGALLQLPERELRGYGRHLLFIFELIGALDPDLLDRAVRWLARRHESLRTSFVRTPSGWLRRVHATSDLSLERVDTSMDSDPEAATRAKLPQLYRSSFDLANPPLIRIILVQLGPERWLLEFLMEHVIVDGRACAIIRSELSTAYEMLRQGSSPSLPPAAQPRHHAEAEQRLLAPIRAAAGPWCAPYPADGFVLRPDPTRPGTLDPAGDRVFFQLGEPGLIDALATANGVSPSAPILAAMALALREITARPDVAFSVVRSGRRDADSQLIVGDLAWADSFFVQVAEDEPPAVLLARTDAFIRDRSLWRMLYNVTISPPSERVLLNIHRYDFSSFLPSVRSSFRNDLVPETFMWPIHDLLVQLYPMPNAVFGVARYRTSYFERTTIERFCSVMRSALRALSEPKPLSTGVVRD